LTTLIRFESLSFFLGFSLDDKSYCSFFTQ